MSALDDEILDLMRFAAQRSMLPRFRALAEHEVEMKGADDPVTIVDREVEAFLTELIAFWRDTPSGTIYRSLLAAAQLLAVTRGFNGTLNLIFQPAEEGLAGAKRVRMGAKGGGGVTIP